MDSQERHELQQNDLAAFLGDFGRFWERWGTAIMGTLAIAALVFAGYNLIAGRAEAARQNAWLDLYGSTSVESLELVSADTKNPVVRALANLRAGDLRLAEANRAEDAEAVALLDQAAAYYQVALETTDQLDPAQQQVLRLNAMEGLGVVAESRYDTAKAREQYQAIVAQAGDAYPQWAARAEKRLTLLDEVSTPITFAADPAPTPAAAPAPGTDPETAAPEEATSLAPVAEDGLMDDAAVSPQP